MSSMCKIWIATKQELQDAILREHVLKHIEPTKSRARAHELIGNLYARYVILCNNLSELYDQTLQVQRRALIEKLLISSQERLKEVQRDIQKIEMSQFVFVDDALVELNLTPCDIEFLRPFYFPRRRSFECQQVIDQCGELEDVEIRINEPPKGFDKFLKPLTREELAELREEEMLTEFANVIKRHERARQARVLGATIMHSAIEVKLKEPGEFDERDSVPYEFQHDDEQVGRHKIRRTNIVADLYAKPLNMQQYDYYTPPVFRINRLGHKVLVPKEKKLVEKVVEEVIDEEEEQRRAEEEKRLKLLKEEKDRIEKELRDRHNAAATVIQRNFLNYLRLRRIKRRRDEKSILLGMFEQPADPDSPNMRDALELHAIKRRERKREFDAAFLKALEDEKARIVKMKSASIMEDITEDIRAWFREFYDKARDFHRYPEEFEGGTIMVMYGETMTPEEFIVEKEKTPKEKAQERKNKRKARKAERLLKKKEKAKEKAMELKRKQRELKEGVTFDFTAMKEWKAFETLEKTFTDGLHEFELIDELKNRKDLPIWEWVTVDAYCDVHKELRAIVDDLMRVELQLLRFALSLDLKKPYVPQKPKKPKRERKKKKKGQRNTIVDIFEERSVGECFNELKALNIIREYEKKSLDDFIGDRCYAMTELRALNKDPPVHYGDVRNYIQTEILGTAAQIKSFCIIGPEKCGKKYLVEALCSEMGAVMFDLSAPKIKDIEDMPTFLDLVLQVAVKFQPSVLFVDGAHKPFIRKADDEVKLENPAKLGKYLYKEVVKNLTIEDAVMLIGVTSEPWNCNFRSLRQCYEKFAVFPPKLDFGTALMAWRTGLRMKRVYNFDVTPLGEVSRVYFIGDILDSIDKHLDFERRVSLPCKPLTCSELLENLIGTKQPIQESAVKQFHKFAAMLDPFSAARKQEIARAQIEIDKAKAEKEQKAKKKAKK